MAGKRQGLIPKKNRVRCHYCGTVHWYRSSADACEKMAAGRTKKGTGTAISSDLFYSNIAHDFHLKENDEISEKHHAEREILKDAIEERKKKGKTRQVKDKVRVAFDLDGVCADLNTYLSPHSYRKWEVSPKSYDFVKSEWFKGWKQQEGEFGLYHDDVMHRAHEIPINDYSVVEAIEKLQQHTKNGGPEYEIFFLTDRPEYAHESSVEFLRRAGVNMDNHELIITGGKKKSTFKPDYLVDDAPKNVLDMYANTEDSIGVTYSHGYNHHLAGLSPRVKNLVEYADFIIDRENEFRSRGV